LEIEMIPLPPWVYGAAALATIAVSFGAGWRVAAWRCEAARTEALEQQQEQFDRQLAQQQRESTEYERDRQTASVESRAREAEVRTIYRDIIVPAECEPPAGAVSVLNDAIRAANARASGEPGGTVPAPSGTP
jgi:hypothetical protein